MLPSCASSASALCGPDCSGVLRSRPRLNARSPYRLHSNLIAAGFHQPSEARSKRWRGRDLFSPLALGGWEVREAMTTRHRKRSGRWAVAAVLAATGLGLLWGSRVRSCNPALGSSSSRSAATANGSLTSCFLSESYERKPHDGLATSIVVFGRRHGQRRYERE